MTLGKYLSEAHIPVTGFYSRTKESAAWAAAFTKTAVFDGLKELITARNTLLFSIADDNGIVLQRWIWIYPVIRSAILAAHYHLMYFQE